MKTRAPQNRTLTCTEDEITFFSCDLLQLSSPVSVEDVKDRVINQDFVDAVPLLPRSFVDLLILDPPYNLTKNFNGNVFRAKEAEKYASWFEDMLSAMLPLLTSNASIYICSDWRTSTLIFPVLERHLRVRNRITWEREKGRGAKTNWKNNTEDIWFCTVGEEYTFNVDTVKLKRKVIAPYRQDDGKPKDWKESKSGKYRLTHPSNL